MKPMHIFGSLVLAAFLLSASAPVAKQLPSITITDLQGKPVNIVEFTKKNKLTVLSFWATWCSPCKRELDAVSELYPDWKEKMGIELVAITIDNARALSQVKPIIEEKGW